MNSATMHGTESVRVRLFNTYGPGEPYSTYRSVICRFVYSALHDLPITVYLGHTRTSTYITDMATTLANIAENFKAGEVYNVAGVDYHDTKSVSDLILRVTGKSDRLVQYADEEPFTTKHKKVDVAKAVRDLSHAPKVRLEQGIVETVEMDARPLWNLGERWWWSESDTWVCPPRFSSRGPDFAYSAWTRTPRSCAA